MQTVKNGFYRSIMGNVYKNDIIKISKILFGSVQQKLELRNAILRKNRFKAGGFKENIRPNIPHRKKILSLNVDNILNYLNDNNEATSEDYGFAMERCNKEQKYWLTEEIMKLGLHKEIELKLVTFNILFNGLGMWDKIHKVWIYWEIMLKQYNIEPNISTFSILLTQCHKYNVSKKVEIAEKLYDIMRNEYNITPNSYVFNSLLLIYKKMKDYDKAEKIFNEFLNSNGVDDLKARTVVWNTYLSIYASQGDMHQINNVLGLMKQYNIEKNILIYTTVMSGCLNAKKPDFVLKLYDEIVKQGILMDHYAINCKYFAYSMIQIEMIKNNVDSYQIMDKIVNESIDEFTKYRQLIMHPMELRRLSSSMLYWLDKDPTQTFEVYDQIKDNFQYIIDGKYISFNCFEANETIQYGLRYMFAYELNDDIFKQKQVRIKGNTQFISSEIKNWNMDINPETDIMNPNVLIISVDDINKCRFNNPCIKFFENPSKNWKIYDNIFEKT